MGQGRVADAGSGAEPLTAVPWRTTAPPSKIRADVLGSPLSIYSGWFLEVDCGGSCPRGRLYRVGALARAHGDRTVGDVVRRFRCQVCGRRCNHGGVVRGVRAAAGAAGRTGVRVLSRWTMTEPNGTCWLHG